MCDRVPLRILFDGHAITSRRSWIGDYSFMLCAAMVSDFSDEVELSIFASDAVHRVHSINDLEDVTRSTRHGDLYAFRHQWQLPGLLRAGKFDLFHSPDGIAPIVHGRVPIVVTIHDIIPLRLPQLSTGVKSRHHRIFAWVTRRVMNRSAGIITVSQFSKRDIMDFFRLDSSAIHVVYNAAAVPAQSESSSRTITDMIGGRPYLLFVGRRVPYKGLDLLINAFQRLRNEAPSVECCLVLAGEEDARVRSTKGRSCADENIIYTGYVDQPQLSSLYSHATAFVFP